MFCLYFTLHLTYLQEKLNLTTQVVARKLFHIEKGVPSMNISKQGFLKQRKKLNFEAFSFLNKVYLQDFYSSEEPIL